MKVWITRFALTKGIIETDAEVCIAGGGSMIKTVNLGYFHKSDWYKEKSQAICRAQLMREAKIKSLKKTIEKLYSMEFK